MSMGTVVSEKFLLDIFNKISFQRSVPETSGKKDSWQWSVHKIEDSSVSPCLGHCQMNINICGIIMSSLWMANVITSRA